MEIDLDSVPVGLDPLKRKSLWESECGTTWRISWHRQVRGFDAVQDNVENYPHSVTVGQESSKTQNTLGSLMRRRLADSLESRDSGL